MVLLWRNWEDLKQMRKDFEKFVKTWPQPDSVTLTNRGYALKFDWGRRIIGKYLFDFNFEPVETYTAPDIEKVLSAEKLDTTGMNDIVEGLILYDPQNFFAEFKRKLQNYPLKLSRLIVKKRSSRLHEDYFIIKTNIGRKDIFATTFYMVQFFEDAGHLLFALNRRWYPGTKRLAKGLAKLEILPSDYVSLMEKALDPTTIRRWDALENILGRVYLEICSLSQHK